MPASGMKAGTSRGQRTARVAAADGFVGLGLEGELVDRAVGQRDDHAVAVFHGDVVAEAGHRSFWWITCTLVFDIERVQP